MQRASPHLLVVEDEADIRSALTILLGDEFEVTAAADGHEALKRLDEHRPDAILLDVGLPTMSGFDVLAGIRQRYAAPELPVIMLTGVNTRDAVVRALGMGANDYVIKPLDVRIVRARIRTQLGLKRAIDESRRLERELERRNAELERLNRSLVFANRQMRADLDSAARLQQALLPSRLPAVPGVEFSWAYRPCEALAGDALNVFELDRSHVGMYLLDVSGHGVKAALLSVALHRLLTPRPGEPSLVCRASAGNGHLEPTPPREVAEELNRRFQFDEELEQYFTLFYGVLDMKSKELRYVCAGQPGPLFAPATGPAADLTKGVVAIGWVPDPHYEEQRLTLNPGDRLYIYSDGIDEARNAARETFGRERLVRVVSEARAAALPESLDSIVRAAEEWTHGPFEDDVSALALEIRDR